MEITDDLESREYGQLRGWEKKSAGLVPEQGQNDELKRENKDLVGRMEFLE